MSRNYETDGSEHYTPPQVRVINGVVVKESDVEVHRFFINETNDPDIVAGFDLSQWENTEAAKWVRAHCIGELYWTRNISLDSYRLCYRVVARLTEKDQTFFELKFK